MNGALRLSANLSTMNNAALFEAGAALRLTDRPERPCKAGVFASPILHGPNGDARGVCACTSYGAATS